MAAVLPGWGQLTKRGALIWARKPLAGPPS
jgi:hypothetical protein